MFDSRKRKRHSDHSSKRNYRRNDQDDFRGHKPHHREPEQDTILSIQAHEADLRRGPQARELARSFEVPELGQSTIQPGVGSALILWAGGNGSSSNAFDDDEDDTISLGTNRSAKISKPTHDTSGIWIDRYDARLLLEALPDLHSPPRSTSPGSPGGWSDLPPDTEETFFFSPEEADDYRNEKRRRLFERAQEERVRARLEEERAEAQEKVDDDDPWGGSDEEADDAQKDLMRRTATHLLSSPNPAQLEMRILANHGADKRFAFLKGRWSHTWLLIRAKLRIEREEGERKEKLEKEKGLSMLAGYDSGSESDVRSEVEETAEKKVTGNEGKASEPTESDEMKKELRRQKAKEWAERRRAEATVAGGGE